MTKDKDKVDEIKLEVMPLGGGRWTLVLETDKGFVHYGVLDSKAQAEEHLVTMKKILSKEREANDN